MFVEDIIMGQKPYLIRAMYQWMTDIGYSPRLLVCPQVRGAELPDYLQKSDLITLDVSIGSVTELELGNHKISFNALFSGLPFHVSLPLNCVGAIVAREKEVGYIFDIDDFLPRQYLESNLDQEPTNRRTEPSQNTIANQRANNRPDKTAKSHQHNNKLSRAKKTDKNSNSKKSRFSFRADNSAKKPLPSRSLSYSDLNQKSNHKKQPSETASSDSSGNQARKANAAARGLKNQHSARTTSISNSSTNTRKTSKTNRHSHTNDSGFIHSLKVLFAE